jgi:hypothetical protein
LETGINIKTNMKFEKVTEKIGLIVILISVGQLLILGVLDALGIIDIGTGLGSGLLMFFGVAISIVVITIGLLYGVIRKRKLKAKKD